MQLSRPKTSSFLLALLATGCHAVATISSSDSCRAFKSDRRKEVTHLPGFDADSLPSRQYTGYIPVHGDEHHLWYWLVESEAAPATDPVILWLTGGPGCSSMDALIYENGPFSFAFTGRTSDGQGQQASAAGRRQGIKLDVNPYAWSRVATVIYVDSPVGTGLSFDTKQKGTETDDDQTTDDLLEFITQLLVQHYPHLQQNDLYIAGESYAGVFVPMLATKVLQYNQQAAARDRVNLKGYTVGNGVTDDMYDGNGQPEFAYAMGLIDPPTYTQLQDTCQGSFWNATPDSTCAKQLHDAYNNFYWLNPYDILEDCFTPKDDDEVGKSISRDQIRDSRPRSTQTARKLQRAMQRQAHSHLHPAQPQPTEHDRVITNAAQPPAETGHGRSHVSMQLPVPVALAAHVGNPLTWPLAGVRGSDSKLKSWHKMLGHSVPCSDRRLALAWMNRDDVRAALHAPSVGCIPWQPCSDHLQYHFAPISMIPHHLNVLKQGLRVMIYSGDHDFVVPFTGTRDWVYSLQLPITRPYAPWTIDGQVAGFMVEFAPGLQFVTVKGAGHMVPQTSPNRALHLITRFLYDNL